MIITFGRWLRELSIRNSARSEKDVVSGEFITSMLPISLG
jgi:hypothetical protein